MSHFVDEFLLQFFYRMYNIKVPKKAMPDKQEISVKNPYTKVFSHAGFVSACT